MALIIPEPILKSVQRLANAEPEERERLVGALDGLNAITERTALAGSVSSAWPDYSDASVREMVSALISLAAQRQRWDADEIGDLVASASGLEIAEDAKDEFQKCISELVAVEPLAAFARGVYVMQEWENLFQSGVVITEIRPIFGDDVAGGATGAVVVNLLSLDYVSSGQGKKLQVAMDGPDLELLKNAVDRAIEKNVAAKELIDRAGIGYFEYEEE